MNRLAAMAFFLLVTGSLLAGYWAGGKVPGLSVWQAIPDATARDHGWEPAWVDAGAFALLSYRRFSKPGAPMLTVYLEGDGLAWISPTELSGDPTPRVDRVLRMAVRDDAANVAYLARPCFYLPANALRNCPSDYWSLARYSEEVVVSLDRALDRLKTDAGASGLRLVGVSGGGVLAALVAARRDDVANLITVTGNLDHAVWTARHGVTPLRDSLNAADVAGTIDHIPQVHFVGTEDTNVTRDDLEAYLARMDDPSRSHVVVVPGQAHVCCWDEIWPGLLDWADGLMAR